MALFGSGGGMNFDSPLYRVLSKIFDIVMVGLLWIGCCCGIITIGASTAALYYVMLKLARNEEGPLARSFFHSFRMNFRQSVPLTLLELVYLFVVFFEFLLIRTMSDELSNTSALYGLCVAALVIGVGIFSWIFPYLARFSDTVGGTIRKGALLAFAHFPRTLFMTGLKLIPVIWLAISPDTLFYSLWFWLFLGGGFISYLCSFMINPVFDRIMPPEEHREMTEEEQDEAYDELKKTWDEEERDRTTGEEHDQTTR